MSQAINFSLILLYDKISSSLPVVQALKEKDIEVHIAQNAGELIQNIANKHADIVGLSVNHASTNSLIQVLRDKTDVKILVFGEDKLPSTIDRIEKCDADFKISGIATAYNVWMKIAGLVKERQKESESQTSEGAKRFLSKRQQREDQDSIIITSREKETKEENTEVFSFSKKNKESKKNKLKTNAARSGEDNKDQLENTDSETIVFRKEKEEKFESKIFKKDKPQKKQKKNPAAKSEDDQINDELGAIETMFSEPFSKKAGRTFVDPASQVSEKESRLEAAMAESKQFENNAKDGKVTQKNEEEKEDLSGVDFREDESSDGKVISLDGFKKKKSLKGKESSITSKKQNNSPDFTMKEQVALKDLVFAAGASTCAVNKESQLQSFGSINKITVVPVDKNSERGFLLFCTQDNQYLTPGTVIDGFKTALAEKMNISEAYSIGENYNIDMSDVEFSEWVHQNCDFHFIFEDPKTQRDVLIAFLPQESIYPDTNKAIHMNMFKVDIQIIPVLTPVNFNVFLYFARNKRLIPYLRRGGKITEEQIGRLQKRGLETFYINESDRKALYSFFITQVLQQDTKQIKKPA